MSLFKKFVAVSLLFVFSITSILTPGIATASLIPDSPARTISYIYDSENRLIRTSSSTETVTYTYDADGNRVSKTISEGTIYYLVDTNREHAQVLAEYKSDGSVIASYVYGDELVAMKRGGETYYYHTDGLGSVTFLTDTKGAVTDTYEYDAFGNLIDKTGNTENAFLFSGQQYDSGSELYYLRARYYQPTYGRFVSVDPWSGTIEAPVTLHRYLYADSDPVNNTDPSGKYTLADINQAQQQASSLSQRNAELSRQALRILRSLKRLQRSSTRLNIGRYNPMKGLRKTGDNTHHIIERRFFDKNLTPKLKKVFKSSDDMPCSNIKVVRHKDYTKAWRKEFGYAKDKNFQSKVSPEDLLKAAEKVYKHDPELLFEVVKVILLVI